MATHQCASRIVTARALGLLALLLTPAAVAQSGMQTIQTRYYVLHTDLEPHGVAEAVSRITLMAEEYHRRTRGLAGTVERRLPFYLFKKIGSFIAAGGPPGAAGVFTGDALVAVLVPGNTAATWYVVQHEGFHQFVHAAIGDGIPIWANEGLAEYFAHGVYTGDAFYTGLILPKRLAIVRQGIEQGRFKSLREMMLTPHGLWNAELNADNYHQAWSMVHFLAHADGGRYQNAFFGFLKDVSRQYDWERAWVRNFGNDDVAAFEARWREYWMSLPEDPTAELRAETVVATVTSFFARAFSQRQQFKTFDEFVKAAQAGPLKAHDEQWLPHGLLQAAFEQLDATGKWSLEHRPGRWMIVCQTPNGTRMEGRFKIYSGRVKSVEVKRER